MFQAILKQVHHPARFTVKTFRRQIAYFMIKNCTLFAPYLEYLLKESGLNYKSYIRAIYDGRWFGDHVMLGAIGLMYNIGITVVSPMYRDVWPIFHNKPIPHVVLIFNGQDFHSALPVTHVSGTEGASPEWTPFGSNIGEVDMYIYAGYANGKRKGTESFKTV